MAHQEQHNMDNTHQPMDHWVCFQCNKPTSASRPPTFNPENCSCVEVGTHATGGGEYSSQPMVREDPFYHYDTTQCHIPQSYASSSLSAPWPEGPEKEDPNTTQMHYANTYLPLVPGPGLGEAEHRRTASFNSDMSYPMQRFLGEPLDYLPQSYATEHAKSDTKYLKQDLYIQASKKVHKGTRGSKQSYMSSGSAEAASFSSWGGDPTSGTGAWAGHTGDSYSMTLSELDDFHIHDETN